MALLSFSAVHAQNVQTNNQGVIVNQVLVTPAYPVKTSADYVQDYMNGRGASAAAGAAAANEYLQNAIDRSEATNYLYMPGEEINDPTVFEVKDKPFTLHSMNVFTASDDLEWTIPLGTRFQLLTLPGPGGIMIIKLLNLNLRVPAESDGYRHTPGLIKKGYIQIADLRRPKSDQ